MKAWEMEREIRDNAVPKDRRKNESHWYKSDMTIPYGDELIKKFWKSNVPGSLAPEIPYLEMTQALSNQGYDVSAAENLIPEGIQLFEIGDIDNLRVLTAKLLNALNNAPKIADHPYHQHEYPMSWEEIYRAMPISSQASSSRPEWKNTFKNKIYQGWIGQLAGGSFGTAIEGYIGSQIELIYGEVDSYITTPETTNDDVVYELAFLDAFAKNGRYVTSQQVGLEWIKQIQFGWSAEWIAIRNLNMGIFPPESGRFLNFYSDWIGAQMRGMVCGMLAPAWPVEAARLAFTDAVVSHSNNGVYGEIAAAVMTALSFEMENPRDIIQETLKYLPAKSEYVEKYLIVLDILRTEEDPNIARGRIEPHFIRYNWIHSYPNMAADLHALWYGNGDFSESMKLLAKSGNDVDCNAGLVGNILGIIRDVPRKWSDPIGDLLETYIKGKERLSIRHLAEKTSELAQQ
jgi:ADP-ribosylglycohydrolase